MNYARDHLICFSPFLNFSVFEMFQQAKEKMEPRFKKKKTNRGNCGTLKFTPLNDLLEEPLP